MFLLYEQILLQFFITLSVFELAIFFLNFVLFLDDFKEGKVIEIDTIYLYIYSTKNFILLVVPLLILLPSEF